METISKYDLQLLRHIFSMTESSLLKSLPKVLENYYEKKNIHHTKNYIYVCGEIPVAIVCHLDTVHRQIMSDLYHDSKKYALWSPQGLGADDRAGVFSSLKLLECGYRPSLIMCTKEESGGIGATEFTKDYAAPAVKTNFLIELDRQGSVDSVYYDYNNEKFEEYINSYGFITDWGTFSDISIISPHWKIAAVNLSIGYIREHTLSETLFYNDMFDTIEKVKKILDAEIEADHTFEYIEQTYDSVYFSKWMTGTVQKYVGSSQRQCDCCGSYYSKDALTPVGDAHDYLILCPTCVSDYVGWCRECGRAYIETYYTDGMCEHCFTKEKEVE